MRRDEFPIVDKFAKDKVNDVLDKIIAEINKLPDLNPDYEMDKTTHVSKWAVFDIIDKYRKESEDEHGRRRIGYQDTRRRL